MKGSIKINRKLIIVGILLIICLTTALVMTMKKTGGIVGDEAAFRSRPKTTPAGMVDPNIINKGTNSWQGQNYINTAKSALNLVNQQRANNGLAALEWDDSLAACAMIRATELPSAFSHSRPNGSDWYTVCPDIMYGENLAQGFNSPDAAVNAWMNSTMHRENILKAGFVSCGIGIYENGGKWYWVQEFGYY
ncbi:CAP domain-containing protein [Oribacterium sp. WCC10]|uniref:CAP domain-containing protein n=1 Tax=Oribacterium sp. WCC10 TaxID=1855343 RepID=UPI0008EF4A89|nr:CAP domain-containing protein [Oribacterium sp. WCC10]SFG76657.1 Cysteine-rich secretory protein family protein [Oribacterium sp. WCC10]